jgi:HlyD family secretion protein
MIKKIIIALVVLGVIAAAVVFFITSKKGDGDGITTVELKKGDIVDKALAIGRIEPKNEIAVKSKISGIAKKLFVEVGDYVKVGEPLIDISPDPTPLEFAEAKRAVEIAEVAHENARKNYERSKELLEKKHISEKDFDDSRTEYDETRLRLRLAEEKLSLVEDGHATIADKNVSSVIPSPINGTILEKMVDEGDPVVPLTSYQAGTELLILAEMTDLIFKGTVDEIDVGKLHQGMPAKIKVGAIPGEPVEGVLHRISPKAREEENTTVFDVEIKITKRGEKMLRAGYSANAELVINEKKEVLLAPERLVHFKSDSAWVEIQDSAGGYDTVCVETGLSDGLNVEITSGLEEGALLVERPPKEIE